MKLTVTQFRVLNYRNINDSGWIPLERVTAFVGRNEAGKPAILKVLHKFNPAIEDPDYSSGCSDVAASVAQVVVMW